MHKGVILKENALDNSDKIVELDLTLTENRDGGPLFNKSGKVIGLLLGKSLAKKSFSYLKNTSENSSFAIKSSYLKKIMTQPPSSRNKDTVNKPDFNSGINVKNISEEAIMSFVASKVSTFKHVREVEFIEAIPTNPSGKILRRLLKDQ